MKVSIFAATKEGHEPTELEIKQNAGRNAGICYMPDDFEALKNESCEKTQNRAGSTLKSGHHSVFEHSFVTLTIEGAPKILAMVLNNEKVYTTSEKSGRYTKMLPDEDLRKEHEVYEEVLVGKERELYEKWIGIFTTEVQKRLPELSPRETETLALENARYLVSVFTPATTMDYSVSIRQLNYMLGWIENWLEAGPATEFEYQLLPILRDFSAWISAIKLEIEGLRDGKERDFSLFAPRKRAEEFGENYCTNYDASLAEVAQAQRHRTIYYEIAIPDASADYYRELADDGDFDNPPFFVPPILDGELREQWCADMLSVMPNYPQGMLVHVNERGTFENFLLKCKERLCGQAQFEIQQQTAETLREYYRGVGGWPYLSDSPFDEPIDSPLWQELNKHIWNGDDRRCRMGVKCDKPCIWVRRDGSLHKRFV